MQKDVKKDNETFLTIDATGINYQKYCCNKAQIIHLIHLIFLYQCVLVSKDGNTPVFQMISADYKTLMIAFFLRNITAVCLFHGSIPRT